MCAGAAGRRRLVRSVRRSAPFATPPRSALRPPWICCPGRHVHRPAELRPRLVYDRGIRHPDARPARSGWRSPPAVPSRTAACSPSTWPPKSSAGRRTRRGDGLRVAARRCHLAGATSWRITEITHDRVMVARPGQPGGLLFWRGDDSGAALPSWVSRGTVHRRAGWDEPRRLRNTLRRNRVSTDYAVDNLWQRRSTTSAPPSVVPSDTTLLVERFRDELSDWRWCCTTVRAEGARPAGAGGQPPAAGALRHRREAHGLR